MLAVAVTAASVALGAVVASAASLGGVNTTSISALTMAASTGAPMVIAYENFTGANGTNLNGTSTDGGGKTWVVNPAGGSWTILTNQARSTTANSKLVIDAGTDDASVVATVFRNGAGTFAAGVAVNGNTTGTQYLSAEWTHAGSGSLRIRRYNSGYTTLAQVTNLYPGGIGTAPSSIVLKLTSSSAGVLTASINGSALVTHTLSAGDQTIYKNATHQLFGLHQRRSNGLTWDEFHLDNP